MFETVGKAETAATAGLEVDLRYSSRALELDLSFRLQEPWSVLFAPSGAGKSTALRIIAGLLRPMSGRITSVGAGRPGEPPTILTNTDAGVFLPPFRRNMGLVAQDPALFPHLSVLRNVLYGASRKDRLGRIEDSLPGQAMELCRISHLAQKMPAELSGGERQRVALARALAARPRRLLMIDELFTGTDAALRDALMAELRPWLRRTGTPVLQVTHDLGDVLTAEAEVMVMENGRIFAQGRPEIVLKSQMDRLSNQLTRAAGTA